MAVEAYKEHKFWKAFGQDFFVVGGKKGIAAGKTQYVPKPVRTAFEAYWRALHEEGIADSSELRKACADANIPFFKSWHTFERDTGFPYRAAVEAALAEAAIYFDELSPWD